MQVDSKQDVLEAFGGIVHEAELEPLLIAEGLRQGTAQGIGGQSGFMAVLQLRKKFLKQREKDF